MSDTPTPHRLRAWILTEPTQPEATIWGLSTAERLRRALLASGLLPTQIDVGPATTISGQEDFYVLIRSGYVFDDRVVRSLVTTPDTILMKDGKVVATHVHQSRCQDIIPLLSAPTATSLASLQLPGLQTVTPLELAPAYTSALRKADPPYVLPASSSNVADIEARIFAASYKGVTDLVTKWVWPKPARVVTRWLAYVGVSPNVVTLLSWVLVVLAAWLFARGEFGLGLVAAWVMTFLDTVDGKLARVTLTSSRVGHVLDHGLDLVHPPFWYLAWAIGLPDALFLIETSPMELTWDVTSLGNLPWLDLSVFIIVTGYIIGRLIEGLFLLLFKIEIHCWQPVDSFFRTITARRNPNMLLLTAGLLVGYPDYGFLWVAVWTACCIGFHTVRLAQACIHRFQGKTVQEWQKNLLASFDMSGTALFNVPNRPGNSG
ncbi:MAG: CDP-alcohol phosphatidyltransferase family protein [Candidatus Binatia bacterium]